jgi:integrase/recombinase XerD
MATATLYLDLSKTLKKAHHPIRIQVYHVGKQDKFTTKLSATKCMFTAANRQFKKQLDAARIKAETICERLGSGYTKERFKRMYYSEIDYTTKTQRLDLENLYSDYIQLLEANHNSPKTILYHNSSKKCFLKYQPCLSLQDVTVEWLNCFEQYMLGRGKTLTAVGSYVRSLRTIFNKAIDDGLIGRDNWPFGKRKYQPATAVSAKSFLTPQEIEKLKRYQPRNEAQQRSKDFWLFCYYINGIAPVDALQLTPDNIRGNHIIYQRQKTRKSTTEAKQIVAYIHDDVRAILERWGVRNGPYLFDVLRPGLAAKEKVELIDTWKRLTNRVLNRIGEKLELREALNLYSARHTWATMMKINNVSVADISDGLGHANLVITQNYLGSIVTDKIKTMSALL